MPNFDLEEVVSPPTPFDPSVIMDPLVYPTAIPVSNNIVLHNASVINQFSQEINFDNIHSHFHNSL